MRVQLLTLRIAAAGSRGSLLGFLLGIPIAVAPVHAQAGGPTAQAVATDSGAVAAADRSPDSSGAPAPPGAGPRSTLLTLGINTADDGGNAAPADTGARRTKAVQYSDGYYKRLAIHRVASYAELPLFATEFILGQKLINDERNTGNTPSGLRTAHTIVAGGLGALFVVNTVTGVWNLIEARHDPNGRTRRTVHALAMLLADAGFVWTASLAGNAKRSNDAADRHRNAAIASMSVATAATLMMWIWKN